METLNKNWFAFTLVAVIFGLLGYLFFLFIKKKKYLNLLEIFYLSLIGLFCFASGVLLSLATYFLALFFLLFFIKIKRFIFFSSISLSIFLIAITLIFHPFYNDYKVENSRHLQKGLTIEKYFDCPEDTLKKSNKIIN